MNPVSIYDISLNLCVGWTSHSLSNTGSNGTNRLLGRQILLADGTKVDAASGNILKHHHAVNTADYLQSYGVPLCDACRTRDGRRAAALPVAEQQEVHPVRRCGLCDVHGYLITGRRGEDVQEMSEAEDEAGDEDSASTSSKRGRSKSNRKAQSVDDTKRKPPTRQSRPSLIEFSFAIGRPDHQAETRQLFTRQSVDGENGQMLMMMPNRAGQYALNVRYRSAGIGVDTMTWESIVTNPAQRLTRHRAVLSALRDQILSPGGARTATMLPHVTELVGAICIRHTIGRAPVYSGLDPEFVQRLRALRMADLTVYPFENINQFGDAMERLITSSVPVEVPARVSQWN
jgi:CRISPR-associated autoregulator DevR family